MCKACENHQEIKDIEDWQNSPVSDYFSHNNNSNNKTSKKIKKSPDLIQHTHRIRIYPNKEVQLILNHWFGSSRFIYNKCLEKKKKSYERRKEFISKKDLSKFVTKLKKKEGFSWLKETPSGIYTQKLIDMEKGFTAFFNQFKTKTKGKTNSKTIGKSNNNNKSKNNKKNKKSKKKSKLAVGYPRFKKKSNKQSIRLQLDQRLENRKKNWENGKIEIPGLGCVKYRGHHPHRYPKMITITQKASGKYYITILLEYERYEYTKSYNMSLYKKNLKSDQEKQGKITAIDLGVKNFLVDCYGRKENSIRAYRQLEKKLGKRKKGLKNKIKRSNQYKKQQRKIAAVEEKIANKRKDTLHKISFSHVNDNQVVIAEDLNVKGMIKNKKLAKAITDQSWSEFVCLLKYKAQRYNTCFIQIDRFDPSSKLCSSCKTKNQDLKLNDRIWQCQNCGAVHDRDINAAINILEYGIEVLHKEGKIPQGMRELKRVYESYEVLKYKLRQKYRSHARGVGYKANNSLGGLSSTTTGSSVVVEHGLKHELDDITLNQIL